MTERRETIEGWSPVPVAAGYEATPGGLIRTVKSASPRVLRPTVGPCGFLTVNITGHELGTPCHRVGTLVAATFLGPRPPGSEVRRLDGNTLNDRLENLAYGTHEEVEMDFRKRAELEEAAGAPTHCPEGHRYAPSWLGNWGDRLCPQCKAKWRREYYERAVAAKPPKQCVDCARELDNALSDRCIDCRKTYLLEYRRTWQRENAQPRLRSYVCAGCQTRVDLRPGQSGPLPKWCPPCKRIAQREADQRFRDRRKSVR